MIEPHGFENPGGKEMQDDPRDYTLLGSASPYPEVFMQDAAWNLPVYYQGKQPACGAHAGAGLKVLLDDYESPGRSYTPRFNWIDIKTFDGFAIDDGTDMRSIFKSLKNSGALDFNVLENEVTLAKEKYADVQALTDSMRTLAAPHGIASYAFLTDTSFGGLKQAIYQKKAVILLLRVGAEFWTNKNGVASWQEKDVLPLRAPTTQLSGHFVMAHSYDKDRIYFLNSWSTDWGRKGHGYFGADYIRFVLGAGTAVDKSDSDVSVPAFVFTRDLTLGSTGNDVVELQKYLNKRGFPVAVGDAPGATSHETPYFGPATKNALVKFQKAHGIQPASGYFGPITRKYVQENG